MAYLRKGTAFPSTITEGTLGSGTTFPASHVLQLKTHVLAEGALGTSYQNWPASAVGFDNPIIASSDVLMFFSATLIDNASGVTNHTDVYFNGGGLGSGTSGRPVVNAELYQNSGNSASRGNIGVHTLDTAPGSTTPTYNLWMAMQVNMDLTVSKGTLTFMEIAG